MTDRLLRECAVDLIRASDLPADLALTRVEQVRDDLVVIVESLRVEVAPRRLLRDQQAVERLWSVA